MHINRRKFLQFSASACGAGLMAQPVFAKTDDMMRLTAQEASLQLAPADYPETQIWGYGGRMPGHEIRVSQGARVQQRLVNRLPQATSVHWHGIRIENSMDGVAGLTQDAVETGHEFDYDFTVPDAGTYWYHAHNRSVEQVARGLYGPLIVEEAQAPDVDRDIVLMLDDWLIAPATGQFAPDFDAPHDRSHAGRVGNLAGTNGRFDYSADVRNGERLRLRVVNAANARIFSLSVSGLEGWIMAVDGMPLPQPHKISEPLVLGPGERVDLFVDVIADQGSSAHLVRIDREQGASRVEIPVSQAEFRVTGKAARRAREAPKPLPVNPAMQVHGLEEARRIALIMEGGAMGRMRAAILNGERQSAQQLAQENQFWAFNGVVGMAEGPLARLGRGETARVSIRNDTAFPHAMHLHGMHFREVLPDNKLGPLRDTLLSLSGQTREIAFVADNPGKWLLHCHMLSHAASGMMTWLEVA